MKLLIIGHARHGKDTVAALLQKHTGLSFTSSSWFAAETIIFPILQPIYGYQSVQECYDDRINHRKEWFDIITAFNTPDKAALTKLILAKHDIYVGLRNKDELQAVRHLFNFIVWVDAKERYGPEDTSSCTITQDDANIVITNNMTLADLECLVQAFCRKLRGLD